MQNSFCTIFVLIFRFISKQNASCKLLILSQNVQSDILALHFWSKWRKITHGTHNCRSESKKSWKRYELAGTSMWWYISLQFTYETTKAFIRTSEEKHKYERKYKLWFVFNQRISILWILTLFTKIYKVGCNTILKNLLPCIFRSLLTASDCNVTASCFVSRMKRALLSKSCEVFECCILNTSINDKFQTELSRTVIVIVQRIKMSDDLEGFKLHITQTESTLLKCSRKKNNMFGAIVLWRSFIIKIA